MRIHQMKPAVFLFLIASAFAASMAAFAFSKAGARQAAQEIPFEPKAAETVATSAIASEDSDSQPRSIAETIRSLRTTNQAIGGAMDTRIPPATRRLLTTLKHQLRELIIELLKTPAAPKATTQRLKQLAVKRLAQRGVMVAPPPFSESWTPEDELIVSYGYINSIKFEHPAAHPDWLVVTTELAINCGEDASLYLFEQSIDGYRLTLALQANGYEDVSGGQNSFAYSISPADDGGAFFIVAADVNAWCTSRWQMLRYKVLRIGANPDDPQIVLSAEHGILKDREPPFKITTATNRFTLTFWHEQSLDYGIMERRYVLSYAIQGDAVKRVAPLAFRPEDFLDEWIDLPWDEAAQWVEQSRLAELQRWHERLQKKNHHCCSDFDSIRLCQSPPQTWQIVVNFSDELAGQLPPQVFFKINRRRGAFFIEDIGTNNDQPCAGRNLLDR